MSSMLLFSFLLLRNWFSKDRFCSVFLLCSHFLVVRWIRWQKCQGLQDGKPFRSEWTNYKLAGKFDAFSLHVRKIVSAIWLVGWFFSHVRKVVSITQCALDEFYLGNCRRENYSMYIINYNISKTPIARLETMTLFLRFSRCTDWPTRGILFQNPL